ncbi:MAG: class I SAM-dependent methyltransferase [Pseudomonadota bacterium]
MDQQQMKAKIQQTFDTVCKGYDCASLRFFNKAAAHLPEVFGFKGDERLLDVAAGTGIPALVCASQLPQGTVTAVDFSAGMLAQAEAKAKAAGLENISFQQMDMTEMQLEEASFDGANCSFGIFFIDDMVATLQHIASKVKPGGAVVTTHFLEGSFEPLSGRFVEQAGRYGIEPPPLGWMRVGTETLNRELYQAAGLSSIECRSFDVGYHFNSADEWWEVIWNAGYRSLLAGLDQAQLARFKLEHLQQIATLDEGNGIQFNIEVLITRGQR